MGPRGSILAGRTFTEVIGRVAYRLIQLEYRRHPERYRLPALGMSNLHDRLLKAGFGGVAGGVFDISHTMWSGQRTAREARDQIVARARRGNYRERRRYLLCVEREAYPPVSNTGVSHEEGHDGYR